MQKPNRKYITYYENYFPTNWIIYFSINLQDDFVFVNGNQKISLRINDGERNVYWNNSSTLNLKLENIEKEKITLSAPGIMYKIGQTKNDELDLEITPSKDIFETDTLKLHLSYKNNKNEFVSHKFIVLIK